MGAFNSRGLVYAMNCYVAAMLALYIAFFFDLPNPWWAALTVFITSQPLSAASGAVLARALHRIAGTLLGAVAALVIVPSFVNSPELLIAAVAAWVALCIYVSLLDRSPRAYAFLLAGYTVAVIALPQATDSPALFANVVARIEEVAIGALCAALIQTLVLPQSIRASFDAKLDAMIKNAQHWIIDALSMEASTGAEEELRKRLAADLAELKALAMNLEFESGPAAVDKRVVRALEERLAALLPLSTAIEDRIRAIAKLQAIPELLALHVVATRRWIESGSAGDHDEVNQLLTEGREAAAASGTAPPWIEALTASSVHRIGELIQAWDDCRRLVQMVREPSRPADAHLEALIAGQETRALHVDHGLAAYAGFAAAVAVILAALLSIATGWQQGAVAVGIAAAGSSVFAFADDPRPMQRVLVIWTVMAVPVAALYIFAFLPVVDGFVALAVAMFPLFFGTALYLATPQHWLRALGFALVSQTLIALQPAQRSDFIAFTTACIACVTGGVVALVVTSLMRVVTADVSSWRILRAGWRDLAHLARSAPAESKIAWVDKMTDRVGLLVSRLPRATGTARLRLADALNDLRLGVSLIDLSAVAQASGSLAAQAIDQTIARIGSHFHAQARGGYLQPNEDLLRSIDSVMGTLFQLDAGELRIRGLAATTGLRRGLFPDALPYREEGRTP